MVGPARAATTKRYNGLEMVVGASILANVPAMIDPLMRHTVVTVSRVSRTTCEFDPPIPEDDTEATHFPSGAACSGVICSNYIRFSQARVKLMMRRLYTSV